MREFKSHEGIVLPIDREDLDTDQLLPQQFMKRVERTGFGPFLFHELRYLPDGSPDPEFVLNRPAYREATILVTGRNCGCGSSRETAAYAVRDYGFRVAISPSFADIFATNCFKNGILLITLPEADIRHLLVRAAREPGYRLKVDLEVCQVKDSTGFLRDFQIDSYRLHCLLNGLDDIAMTLGYEVDIQAYERDMQPWRSTRLREDG